MLDLSKWFNNKDKSDITIRCKEKVWHLHQIILNNQCQFFAKASEGPFKEGLTGIIDLPDDDPVYVEALLKHCYLTPYTQISTELDGSIESIIFHISVYAIAENFKLLPYDDEKQVQFITAVRQVYETTPDANCSLRRAVGVVVLRDWTKLIQCDDTVKEFVRGTPSKVIMDLLLDLHQRFSLMRKYRCPNCQQAFVAELDEMEDQHCIHCGSNDADWGACGMDFIEP